MDTTEKIPERVALFIRRHHVMTLATLSDDGPWCANLFYAWVRELNAFVFTSEITTRHGREAAANPSVAASIVLETRTVGRVEGLQIAGSMRRVEATDGNAPRNAYLKRFPYAAVAPLELWLLTPHHMKLTDNTLGFGKKITWGGAVGKPADI